MHGMTGRRRLLRATLIAVAAVVGVLAHLIALSVAALWHEGGGTPSAIARSTGHDAEWLGHAWVDGRKTQSDVDALVARLRDTGVRDLLVHTGPFENDGTLDAGRRPAAARFVGAVHQALPGVRVQAWLGAHPGEISVDRLATRAALVRSVGQVLDDGFDGVHYDFEPVEDGDADLIDLLRTTHALTQQRHALLSISAARGEPWAGAGAAVTAIPGRLPMWSGAYLHRVALEVDQVALMAYDSAMPTSRLFAGYVRSSTRIALEAAPDGVALLIGVPAYHEKTTYHRPAETLSAGLLGVRLALADRTPRDEFGVAIYVDFTVTADDWSSYERDWLHPH
jgi:hypothetical protein